LNETYGFEINHKVVGKLLSRWDLALLRAARGTGSSPVERAIKEAGSNANLVKKKLQEGKVIDLFEVMYTDFTALEYANGHRTAMLMAIIGHISKMIFGWALGARRHRDVACRAWEQAKRMFERLGVDCAGMIMHQDQDSVYKSDRWVTQLLEDGVRLSYSTNGAKGNTYMESFNGHFKDPIQSILNEAETMEEVERVVNSRANDWNNDRRHSSLGQMAPMAYIEKERNDGYI
jgi:putative transposase